MKKSPGPANKQNLVMLSVIALLVLVLAGVLVALVSNLTNKGTAVQSEPTKAVGYQPVVGTPSLAPAQTTGATVPTSTTPAQSTPDKTVPASTVPDNTTASGNVTPVSGSAVDERYGLIVTELNSDRTASLNRALELSQARWWYEYTPDVETGVKTDTRQIYMIRAWHDGVNGAEFKQWMQFVQQTGRFSKPTYWLIGNEGNTPGQDDSTPENYAEVLHEANRVIRAADPQATLIGPNTLNFDDTCKACPGFTSGHFWMDQLRKVYLSRYGTEPPLDAWSIHTYNLDWDHLPLINRAQDIRQLEAFRTYLDSTPATRGKPIWLTEFGVVWGYDGLEWQKTAAGTYTAVPRGTYRQDLLEKYLTDSLDWLGNNSERLKIDRWFFFTSYGGPEGFSNIFGGISLFDSNTPTANLTAFGRIYTDRLKNPPAKR